MLYLVWLKTQFVICKTIHNICLTQPSYSPLALHCAALLGCCCTVASCLPNMCTTGVNFLTKNKYFPKCTAVDCNKEEFGFCNLWYLTEGWTLQSALVVQVGPKKEGFGERDDHARVESACFALHHAIPTAHLGTGVGGNHPTMGVSAVPWDLFSDRLTDKTDRWQTYRTRLKNVPTDRLCSTFLQHVMTEWLTVIKSPWQKLQQHSKLRWELYSDCLIWD